MEEIKTSGSKALNEPDLLKVYQELKSDHASLTAMINASPESAFLVETDGRVIACNSVGVARRGFRPEEVVGRSIFDIIPEDLGENRRSYLDRVIQTGEAVEFEDCHEGRVMQHYLHPVRNTDGKVSRVAIFGHDITRRRRAEQSLAETDKRFRQMFMNAPMPYQSLDESGDFIDVNQTFLDVMGYNRDELIGRNFASLLHPDWVDHFKVNFPRFKAIGEVLGVEFEMRKKNGSFILVSFTGRIQKDDQGGFQQTHCIFQDITDRRRSEQALIDSERKWRNILVNTPQIGITLDTKARIIFANAHFLKLTGWAEEEVLGQDWFNQFIPELLRDTIRQVFLTIIENKNSQVFFSNENEIITRTGEVRKIAWSNVLTKDAKGSVLDVTCLGLDLTERIKAEEQLAESHALLSNLARLTPGVIYQYLLFPDGRSAFPYASPGINDLYEVTPEEARADGAVVLERIHPDDRKRVSGAVLESARSLKAFYCDFRVVLPRKGLGWRWSQAQPQRLEDGSTLWHGFVGDITERKSAEIALQESEERFRVLIESAPMSVMMLQKGKYTYANPASLRLLGCQSSDGLIGANAMETIAPEFRDSIQQRMARIEEGGDNPPFEFQILRPDGGRVWTLSTSVATMVKGEPAAIIVGQDITTSKSAEAERIRLMSAIEHTTDSIIITDLDGTILYVNPAFEFITGFSAADALGQNPRILKSGEHDEDFYHDLWQTILSGKTWKGRLTNKRKDGALYMEEAAISPVMDSAGRIVNFVAVKRDITAEIQMEEKLRQAQRMESIGTLAGGIAHDFNNILFPIIGLSEMLLEDLPPESMEQESIQEILTAGKRGAELVKQILAFSRQTDGKKIPMRIQQILKEVMKLTRSTIPSDIEITQDIQNDCGMVLADPTQVHQIAMNLITNAFHAVEAIGGKIQIQLKQTVIEGMDIDPVDLKPGHYALLTITDTGCGIPGEVMDKIFDPYFTTKPQGKGTGLGLAVVYGILKEHHGDIKVYSKVGEGSVFQVYLPLIDKSFQAASPEKMDRLPGGHERILLVDDESAIVRLERQMLERLGYGITDCSSSPDALKAFAADPSSFDLVMTDMSMPNMTGEQLAMELIAIRPDIPVIICTGFSERIHPEKAAASGIRAVLMKPVVKTDMAKTIRRVLDERQKSVVSSQ